MQITEFKKIGNSNRYKMFVDGDFFAILMDEDIVKYHLKLNTEYSASQLNEIATTAQNKVATDMALNLVSKFLKTEKQIKDYLKEKSFTQTAIDYAINKLKEYNYINDIQYAKNYVQSRQNSKGKRAIKFELKAKGIAEEIINRVLDETENSQEVIEKLALKFVKNKKNDEKIKEKLFRHLVSKGFEFDEIKSAIDKVIKTEDD